MLKTSLYMAAGLFNIAEIVRNATLGKMLEEKGYNVELPQIRAKQFMQNGELNLIDVAKDCADQAKRKDSIIIACLDGATADDGTALEIGLGYASTGRCICYRTDFRTNPEKLEQGINAMFGLPGIKRIYFPAYVTTLEEANSFYGDLANKIDHAIQEILYQEKLNREIAGG